VTALLDAISRIDEMMLSALLAHGADPKFVLRVDYHAIQGAGNAVPRRQITNAVTAAVGMGGGDAWVQPERGEREALTLETVKLALERGADVNLANTDGRTALDAAKTLKFEKVEALLIEKGAKPGKEQ
jgi:ankyrin repeat protein